MEALGLYHGTVACGLHRSERPAGDGAIVATGR